MEAKELMIGNYVLQDNEFIKGITSNSIHKFDLGFIKLEPIPITEEWLLNFGFEKTEFDYKIQIQKDNKGGNTDYWIYVDSGIDNQTNKFIIQILSKENCWFTSKNEYVHQLQNLYFSLTGEELIIK